MSDLKSLLDARGATLEEVTAHLEKLPHPERIAQTVALDRRQQTRLWDLAESGAPLTLDFLLPSDAPPLCPFPFEGRNTLPFFTRFRKVFYRTLEGTIAGYNDQALSPITGPGYYVVHLEENRPREIAVDYLQVPSSRPAGWPDIRPNEIGLSRFIYGGMIDYLRRVSSDVVIGRAFKGGTKAMPAWFALCRWQPRA